METIKRMPAPRPEKTATEAARALLSAGFYPKQVAEMTKLSEAYVRKIRQRDDGRDEAWQRWRRSNPDKVRNYWIRSNSARQGRR